jgi:hypothetical protein
MRKGAIYLMGVVVLGIGYAFLKDSLGNPVFFIVAVAYLVGLRILANIFGNRVGRKMPNDI